MTPRRPEQQPTSEPENSPADAELDIDAAKKYLGSSIIVDKSIPILEQQEIEKESAKKSETEKKEPIADEKLIDWAKSINEDAEKARVKIAKNELPEKPSEIIGAENTQQFYTTEIVDRSIPISEKQEMVKPKEKVTAEELAERVKAAKNELIDLAKGINEAREKKETKTEISLYDKVKEVFEVATGESLEKIATEKAKIEAENEGLKITTIKEYRKEKTVETQDRIRQKERSAVIKERWYMLSDEEKARYFDDGKDKNNSAAINSARIKFAAELNKKIDAKKQELSKGEKGIVISEDVFYELMKKGLKPEDMKKRGFLGRIFFGGEIKIPPLDKTDRRGSFTSSKEYLTKWMEVKVKKNIEEAAQEEIERKIIEGRRRWKAKKQRQKYLFMTK